jgi:hypothetical protein
MKAKHDIQPNFSFQLFTSKKEAAAFLAKMGFHHIENRSDYTIWETRKAPKVRANFYQDKTAGSGLAKFAILRDVALRPDHESSIHGRGALLIVSSEHVPSVEEHH